MRFLADENFPGNAVKSLQAAGHDVKWLRTVLPGMADDAVLALAAGEGRILLTFDKDFGELARNTDLPASVGIVLFRVPVPRHQNAGDIIAAYLSGRSDWADHFSVVEPMRVRMRPLRRDGAR